VITEAKMRISVYTKLVCLSGTQRFCKNDSDSSLESWVIL